MININSHQIMFKCAKCKRPTIRAKCTCKAYIKQRIRQIKYVYANRENINQQRRDYRVNHGDKVRAHAREYREKNKEHINALKRKYYAEKKKKEKVSDLKC